MRKPKIGGTNCAVVSCRENTRKKLRSFFRFPKEKERCFLWLEKIGRLDLLKGKRKSTIQYQKICSKHFEDSMYFNDTKNRLKDDAVPTLFLETNDQPEPQEEPGGLLRKLLCEPKETPDPTAPSDRLTFEFVHCENDDDDDVQIIEPVNEIIPVNEKTVEKDCVELRRMLMTYEHKRDRRKELPQEDPIKTAPEDDNCILRNILLSYKHTQDTIETVPLPVENIKTVEKDCTELRKMLLFYEQQNPYDLTKCGNSSSSGTVDVQCEIKIEIEDNFNVEIKQEEPELYPYEDV